MNVTQRSSPQPRKHYSPEVRAIAKRAMALRGVRAWNSGTRHTERVLRLVRSEAKRRDRAMNPEFVLRLAGVEDLDQLRAIAMGDQDVTPELYELVPRSGPNAPWLAAVLVAHAEQLASTVPGPTTPLEHDELRALIAEYVATQATAARDAPMLGAPFIQEGRIYIQLEGRGGVKQGKTLALGKRTGLLPFLRTLGSPMGEFKRPLQLALAQMGFTRNPFAYVHPKRGSTAASYYSIPLDAFGIKIEAPERGR